MPSNFTDLSKIKAGSFDLRRTVTDLYALAFAWLTGREDSSEAFANMLDLFRLLPPAKRNDKASLSDTILRDSDVQSHIFVSISGPYMGADKTRGAHTLDFLRTSRTRGARYSAQLPHCAGCGGSV